MKYKRTTKTEKQEIRVSPEEKELARQAAAQSATATAGTADFWRASTLFVAEQVIALKAGKITPEMAAYGFQEFIVSLIEPEKPETKKGAEVAP